MRRRLLISMLAVAIAAVLALGIPLAIVLARLQVDDANNTMQQHADTIATDLNERFLAGLGVDGSYASQLGRKLNVQYMEIQQDGAVVVRTGHKPGLHDTRSKTGF